METLITIAQMCQKLQVSRQTLKAWIDKKGMPCIKIDRAIRFSESEVNEWLKAKGEQ